MSFLSVRGVGEKIHTKTLVSENMHLTDCNTSPYHKCIDLRQVLMDQAKLKWLPWLLFILFHFSLLIFLSFFQLTSKIINVPILRLLSGVLKTSPNSF